MYHLTLLSGRVNIKKRYSDGCNVNLPIKLVKINFLYTKNSSSNLLLSASHKCNELMFLAQCLKHR